MAYGDYDRSLRGEQARTARTSRLHALLRKGRYDEADGLVGVPPGGPGSGRTDDAAPGGPPDPEAQFCAHRDALLLALRSAEDFLPRDLLQDWESETSRLDRDRPGAGLIAIGRMRAQAQGAESTSAPPAYQSSRLMGWAACLARIRQELDCLAQLLSNPEGSR
jgi:hypothetical protein